MQKHLYFWLGVFVSLICGLGVAMGFVGVADDQVRFIVAMTVGAGFAFISLLMLFLLFRRRIFRNLFGNIEGSVNEIADAVSSLIANASQGKKREASEDAGMITKRLLAWWSWSNLYRWVISTCFAILVGLCGFAGTTLLIEQNQKLEGQTKQFKQQNTVLESQLELQGIQVTSAVRELLKPDLNFAAFSTPRAREQILEMNQAFQKNNQEYQRQRDELQTESEDICVVRFQRYNVDLIAQPSSVEQVRQLGERKPLTVHIKDALNAIVLDGDAMAFAALIVMSELRITPEQQKFEFQRIAIGRPVKLAFSKEIDIRIRHSVVDGLDCERCNFAIYTSILDSQLSNDFTVGNSLTQGALRFGSVAPADRSLSSNFDAVTESIKVIPKRELVSSQIRSWRRMKRYGVGGNYVVVDDEVPIADCDSLLTDLGSKNPFVEVSKESIAHFKSKYLENSGSH